jgi:hypothetical protein
MALDSSYLGESEVGPFFIEAIYDRSPTIRGKLWLARIFRGTFLNLEAIFRGSFYLEAGFI